MKDKFRQLPAALQKQVLIRWVLGTIALILFVIVLIYTKEFSFGLPCIVLSAFMIVNSAQLLYNCIKGKFVVIEGVCEEVDKTAIRKRVKSISMKIEDRVVTLPVRYRIKAPSEGDEITVYLSNNAPVYDKDGGYHIYNFYAMEINRKV